MLPCPFPETLPGLCPGTLLLWDYQGSEGYMR